MSSTTGFSTVSYSLLSTLAVSKFYGFHLNNVRLALYRRAAQAPLEMPEYTTSPVRVETRRQKSTVVQHGSDPQLRP